MKQSELNEQGTKLHKDQQSRRSIIPLSDHIGLNIQTSIDDILALELSDTLINAAYHLSAMKIQLAIQKVCVLQKFFVQNMAWGFEGIVQWGNREYKGSQCSHSQQHIVQRRESELHRITQTVKYKQRLSVLRRQQQQQKVMVEASQKLGRMVIILNNKNQKQIYHTLCRLQITRENTIQQLIRKPTRTNKFQPISTKQVAYIRRSIQKNPSIKRTTHQPCSFSLNKDYQSSSTAVSSKATINYNQYVTGIRKYGANISATKSTCSQSSVCQDTPQYNDHSTKQEKQLVILRTKYNKLVQQFHQFSQRFLSVIREE